MTDLRDWECTIIRVLEEVDYLPSELATQLSEMADCIVHTTNIKTVLALQVQCCVCGKGSPLVHVDSSVAQALRDASWERPTVDEWRCPECSASTLRPS